MVTHFSKCEQSLNKVRAQFKEAVATAKREDPTIEQLERKMLYREVLTLEVVQDLEYMNKVMLEALRY